MESTFLDPDTVPFKVSRRVSFSNGVKCQLIVEAKSKDQGTAQLALNVLVARLTKEDVDSPFRLQEEMDRANDQPGFGR